MSARIVQVTGVADTLCPNVSNSSTCSVTVWPAVSVNGRRKENACVVERAFTARGSTFVAAPESVNTTDVIPTSSVPFAVAVIVAPGRSDGPGVTPVRFSAGGVSRTKWSATGVVVVLLAAESVASTWSVVSRGAARLAGTTYANAYAGPGPVSVNVCPSTRTFTLARAPSSVAVTVAETVWPAR